MRTCARCSLAEPPFSTLRCPFSLPTDFFDSFLTADCSLARTAPVVNFQAFARVCSSLPSHPSPAASSSGNYISSKSGSNFFSRWPSSLGSLCFVKTFSDESPMVYRRTRRHRDQQLVLRNSATSMQTQVMEAVPARKGELKRGGVGIGMFVYMLVRTIHSPAGNSIEEEGVHLVESCDYTAPSRAGLAHACARTFESRQTELYLVKTLYGIGASAGHTRFRASCLGTEGRKVRHQI